MLGFNFPLFGCVSLNFLGHQIFPNNKQSQQTGYTEIINIAPFVGFSNGMTLLSAYGDIHDGGECTLGLNLAITVRRT